MPSPVVRQSKRLVALVAVAVAVGGCQTGRSAEAATVAITAPVVSSLPAIPPDAWAARGQIVEQGAPAPLLDDNEVVIGETVRAVYRSTSGVDGAGRDVSGLFAVPVASAPPDGWPVVSVAHGTTGIGNDCGPSSADDLMGFLASVRALVGSGYAVAFSDYEGLGTPGAHPYLEPHTAAFNITDAVRALRVLYPQASGSWLAFGNSQGGQASWAAGELAGFYGDGLDLVGAVALSPAANITPLAQLAYDRALTKEQQALMPLVVAGMARIDPDLDEADFLHDDADAHLAEMSGCGPDSAAARFRYTTEQNVRPDDEAAVEQLREQLATVALPQQQLAAPLLVVYGLDDSIIFPQWTSAAVGDACRMGGGVSRYEIPGANHSDLGADADALVSRWVSDRFAGVPASSNCPRGE